MNPRVPVAVVTAFLAAALLHAAAPSPSPTPPWEAPPETRELQNPVKTDGQTVERGRALYKEHCVDCHGKSGVGDGALARKRGYKPANLTLERLNQQRDGEIFWKITTGHDPMPAFGRQLSDRARWDLVSYVRTLLRETSHP
jgi:mono/diheme cytochrome c family protein